MEGEILKKRKRIEKLFEISWTAAPNMTVSFIISWSVPYKIFEM